MKQLSQQKSRPCWSWNPAPTTGASVVTRKKQPYCDGAHQSTEFSPIELVIEEKKKVVLCQCKRTGNAPYCDGAHKSL